MKLQQLRYLVEVAKHGLNVSEAAERLHTSQPGISKQIRLLEDELGIPIFIRNGKRVVAMSAPGEKIIRIAERILYEADNLKRVSAECQQEDTGTLAIATTHTQARYALPNTITAFVKHFPKVRLSIKQGSPTQICDMVSSGEADLAIATENLSSSEEIIMLHCYPWNRGIVVPETHDLLEINRPLTLKDIAAYPIITYDFALADHSQINQAFSHTGLAPNIILTALDTDVIKTYVSLGLGIGIIANMAFEPERDTSLRIIDAAHLFETSVSKIGIRKNSYLRSFTYTFIELFAPHLKRHHVEAALLTPPHSSA